MPTHWAHSFAFATLVGLVPSAAFGQSATALDRLEPAPAGDGSFAVPSASVRGSLRPSAAIVFSYAHAPLHLRTYNLTSGQTLRETDIVDHQLAAHLLGSIEIASRLKVDLDVPFTLSQGGDSPTLDPRLTTLPTATPQSFTSPQGATMNDVRLGARLVLVQQRGFIPTVSAAYSVWFPSGNPQAYTSTGFVRHAPSLIVGAERDRFVWSVMVGRRIQDAQADAGLIGSEILTGASFAARFGNLTAHAELFGTVTTSDKSPIASAKPNLELLLGARYNLGPLNAGIIGGPGLFRGVGTPTFRVLATVGASFEAFDKTKSVSTSKVAATSKTTPETAPEAIKKSDVVAPKDTQITPPPAVIADRDGDKVPDADDACPDVAGDASATAVRRGCPPDRDGDGIADANDRCPDEKGVATPDPERFGCPFDTDGDGFVDAVDACPNEKGEANEDPKKQGCPKSVRVEGTQIVILQEVNFATGSDKISPDSFALLDQVASVLKQHPDIVRLAVDGHTDNVGAEKSNLTLSQKRAVAVAAWLVEHGVDTRRLEARGFGPRRPLVPNTTKEGKAKNRRVEFQILKRSTDGENAWRPGSVQ